MAFSAGIACASVSVTAPGNTPATFQSAYSGGLELFGLGGAIIQYPTSALDSWQINTGGSPRLTISAAGIVSITGTTPGTAPAGQVLIGGGDIKAAGRISSDNTPAPVAWTGTSAASTGLSVNGGEGGRTLLAMVSSQNGSGNGTASALYMVRLGYDGNNVSVVRVVGDDGGSGVGSSVYTFSQTSGVLYVAGAISANHRISFVSNK
jgi:hypothetical protein